MHGGTTSSGRVPTFSVSGVYWINWNMSFSKTTAPSVLAIFLPTSKTDSSVIEIRPFSKSLSRLLMPSVMLCPLVSRASLMNSGFVAAKLEGAIASAIWRARKRIRSLLFSSCAGMASTICFRYRSEEHTSELQSHHDLVCRLLLEKKKKKTNRVESDDGRMRCRDGVWS